MSRYSNDLRVLAINMLNSQKKSFEEVSKIINVCTKTLRSWFHKDNSGTLFGNTVNFRDRITHYN